MERRHGNPAVERVSRSLMTTMAGVVSVDRAVWETRGQSSQRANVEALGRTGADSHLRQLCASCHLGAEKTSLGPMAEDSRGGGCNACHLQYSPAALMDVSRQNTTTMCGPSRSRNRNASSPSVPA
jgi:hypothetical protein